MSFRSSLVTLPDLLCHGNGCISVIVQVKAYEDGSVAYELVPPDQGNYMTLTPPTTYMLDPAQMDNLRWVLEWARGVPGAQ